MAEPKQELGFAGLLSSPRSKGEQRPPVMAEPKQERGFAGLLSSPRSRARGAIRFPYYEQLRAAKGKSSSFDDNCRLQAHALPAFVASDICCGVLIPSDMHQKSGRSRQVTAKNTDLRDRRTYLRWGRKVSLSAQAVTGCWQQRSLTTVERMCRRSLRYRKPDAWRLR